jgi:hypothetical protein
VLRARDHRNFSCQGPFNLNPHPVLGIVDPAVACFLVTRVDPIRPDDRKHHLALAELIFQYRLELQPWLQAVDINEDVALAELSCDGQRVRGVIPPVVDKDFARHGWIMAWPPTRGAPTGPQFAGFLNGGNSGVSGANRASNGVSTLRFSNLALERIDLTAP